MVKKLFKKIIQSFLHREHQEEDQLKDADVDFADLQLDIFKSREVYKCLIRKVHPDRFLDPELKTIAEDLSQRIVQKKHSYSDLLLLKTEAAVKLSIQFNT